MIQQSRHDQQLARATATQTDLGYFAAAADVLRGAALDDAAHLIAARRATLEQEVARLTALPDGYDLAQQLQAEATLHQHLGETLGAEAHRIHRAAEADAYDFTNEFVLHGRVFDSATGRPVTTSLLVQSVTTQGASHASSYTTSYGYFLLRSWTTDLQVRLRVSTSTGQILYQATEVHTHVIGTVVYRDIFVTQTEGLRIESSFTSMDALAVQAEIDSSPELTKEFFAIAETAPGRVLPDGSVIPQPDEPGEPPATGEPGQQDPKTGEPIPTRPIGTEPVGTGRLAGGAKATPPAAPSKGSGRKPATTGPASRKGAGSPKGGSKKGGGKKGG